MKTDEKDNEITDTVKKTEDAISTSSTLEGLEVQCCDCGNHPCVVIDLEEMLVSILHTYEGWKSKKQICFQMYSDSIKFIHGPGLGKEVRKKMPSCLQRHIHSLVPDQTNTGFKKTTED